MWAMWRLYVDRSALHTFLRLPSSAHDVAPSPSRACFTAFLSFPAIKTQAWKHRRSEGLTQTSSNICLHYSIEETIDWTVALMSWLFLREMLIIN